MNILNIIEKKRDKQILTKEEIEFFIKEYTKENILDYQAASLVMAIYLNDKRRNNKFNISNGKIRRNIRSVKIK